MVNPRNVSETHDLVEVEVSPEETAESSILNGSLRVFALLRDIIQAGIDTPEVTPGPAAAGCRHETVGSALHEVRRILMHILVALLVVDVLWKQVVVVRVCKKLQVSSSLEICLRTEL